MAKIIRLSEIRARRGALERRQVSGRAREPFDIRLMAVLGFCLALAVGWLVFSGTASRIVGGRSGIAEIASPRFGLCASSFGDCVIDGDTFDFAGQRIRIADIDTPEIRSAQCAAERQLGERATRRLQELLNAGPFTLERIDRDEDVYGRKLRLVMRDGRSIGDILVAEQLAHVWDGRKHPWC